MAANLGCAVLFFILLQGGKVFQNRQCYRFYIWCAGLKQFQHRFTTVGFLSVPAAGYYVTEIGINRRAYSVERI